MIDSLEPFLAFAEGGAKVVKSLPHHAVFLLLLQMTVLLFMARLLGEVMRKLKQPPVVGELIAGVVLGPSVFGTWLPEVQRMMFPVEQHQADLMGVVSWIGVLCLLVVTGLETDLGLIRRRGRSALIISSGGILVPFASGLALGWMLPDRYLVEPGARLVFSLFMAVAMSISAVPVIAKVLMDLKLIRRDVGQLILAAAMTDDTIGWIMLSVVAGLATAGQVDVISVLEALGGALLFITAALTIGTPVIARVVSVTDKVFGGTNAQLSIVLVLALGAATLTHQMGIEAVLGAFVMGILVAQAPRFRREVGHVLESVTAGFLAPIFFAAAGLKVDLTRLADRDVAIVGAIVLTIACVGKFVGAYLGGWAVRVHHWERLALGSGMNARGAMEIVVATVGLGLGVLTVEMYSIIVMVAIVTSLMAPPLLRWTLSKVRIGADEAKRLEREEMAATSFVRGCRRVLLVSRTASSMRVPGQMIGYMSHEQPLEAVAIYARPAAVKPRWWWPWRKTWRRFSDVGRQGVELARKSLDLAKGTRPEVRLVSDKDRAELVLVEAARGYDLLVVSDVRRKSESRSPFGRLADEMLRRSPCATMVIKTQAQPPGPARFEPWCPKRIMVPTVGTEYSTSAVEMAAVLAASTKAIVTVVHIVRPTGGDDDALARELVERQAERGRKFGAEVETMVLPGGTYPEEELLRLAREGSFDLMVIGSGLRVVSARAFFGHRVEWMLDHAPCPVAVVTST